MTPPFVRFVALGAALFVAERALSARPGGGTTRALSGGAAAEIMPPAAPGEDPLLARAALSLGLHRDDPVVERRLADNLRSLAPGDTRDDASLAREAMALGMHETDTVVQRRLATQLRLRAAAAARSDEPTGSELERHLADHAESFAVPETRRLEIVSLARERRAGPLDDDVRRLAGLLRRTDAPPGGAARLGDALPPLPARFDAISERSLAAFYGEAFAREAFARPVDPSPGAWSPPLASPLGVHFVRVEAATAARPAELAEVRAAVRESILAGREADALRTLRARLATEAAAEALR